MNTKKTLADAQPGGRVRLEDQAELDRLEFQAWARSIGACVDADEHGNYVDAHLNSAKLGWNAALSAQPSPGGQGDRLRYLTQHELDSIGSQAEGMDGEQWDRWVQAKFAEVNGLATVDSDGFTTLAARQPVGDQHPDDLAVDAFAAAMKAKMAEARAKGRGGWEDPAQCTAEDLSRMLREHVEKGDARDVANFCMMLHQRGEAIAASHPVRQEPVGYLFTDDPAVYAMPGSGFHSGKEPPADAINVVPVYAAPPAQAVDLGQPDPTLLRFYQVSDFPSLVTALEAHVLQLIDLRKRNVKPWEDTMPPTLLPKWVRENSPVLAKDLMALAEKWQDEAAVTWGESPAHAAKQQCCDELRALIDSQAEVQS